ncbi:hypothetical protein B0H67DRAFT_590115 [Lasiosphaeris hirsuta]|uniref:Plus3 domain-containing protein n=1 Tax=Lasiosphaeris hirsuta TaxID=260670 RepID=A0AA40A314_9PEZI|nr:hypothetical protein B0H67DRAFT_590115 [Lasiosphaeris hirsuta]
MSDIDDELLALAGGDVSSDEDEEPMDMSRDESRSPSPAPASASRKETPVKGVATKKGPAKTAKKRARSHDESDEEGEASSGAPSSPASQQSAPMDESDSDSDAPQTKPRGGDDDGNQYPIDGLFRDYEEKENIMSMREIEREQILAERREENERIRQNRMLRQLKVNQEKDIKKRKASAAELDDGQRKTSRVRTKIGETSEKMDTLRRAREERSSRKEQRERENDRRKQHSPGYRRSAGPDEDDSEVEWSNGKSKPRSRSPDAREGPPAELKDIERVRLGRSRFAEVCFNPGFEEAIAGCFVRINIGPDPEKGHDVYRMAVVKGFTQGRAYAMPDQSGHQIVVDTYVKAAHGKAMREWPFIACSDRAFLESEWERYKKVCLAEGVPVPDRSSLNKKLPEVNRLVQRTWTDQELSEKFKRQHALRAKYSGAERDQLNKSLETARARSDEEAVARIQEKIDNLEVPRLAFKTSLAPQKKKAENKGPSQQEKLAILNAENRRRNAEAVRKAQLKERAKARELQMRIDRGETLDEGDNSRRVRTRMKFVHDVNEYKDIRDKNGEGSGAAAGSGTSTPGNGIGTPKSKATLLPHIAKLQDQQRNQTRNGIPTIHKPLMDDDIIGALDLDIDIDID